MAISPILNPDGALHVVVTSDGNAIPQSAQLISVTVRSAFNRVPFATLVFADGDMAQGMFVLSESAHFKPGAAIKVEAGYGDSMAQIFAGIVVRHGLSISGDNDARLIIECRDKAAKMTVGRKNAWHIDKTDADVISQLIGNHALTAKVASSTLVHKELVQHYCTDWDFMLSRAEASGCLVRVDDGTVDVTPPDTSCAAVLKVTYGTDLIDFHADLDASQQYAKVQASAWSMSEQSLVLGNEASPASLNAQGNLDSCELAQVLGLKTLALQTGAPLPKAALDGWAKAQQLKSGLSRLRGRMRFQGSALARLGQLIDLAGVGERFNGPVFVTGVTHQLEDGTWATEVEFGLPVDWSSERSDVMAPAASGLVPGIEGLHVGVVLKLDEDPAGEHRVQVKVPAAGVESVWARLLQITASNAFGAFFAPEIGDEVLLGWFNNDPGYPVVLGSLYSSRRPPPTPLTANNQIKTLVTRCKAKLEFNDEDETITLLTPGNNKMVFSDKDKSIVITDNTGNSIELGTGGITLESSRDIKINAKGTISIDAVGAVSVSSSANVDVDGMNVNCTAKVGMVAKGSATAELSASGQTIVKGAMVMIN